MQKRLISVITPCYNMEKYISRLLESVLMQDYPFVEMYVIDDGSTDSSAEIIKSYIQAFDQKGYSLTYRYQHNQGPASTINYGLKLAKGEYIVWPDADDWYNTNRAFSKFVEVFERLSSDYGVIRCLPTFVDDSGNETLKDYESLHFEDAQFLNCLYGLFFWSPGNYMIRSECLDDVNPLRKLYIPRKGGQNRQILLPILYKYKLFTINKSFHSVLTRSDSMSRISLGPEHELSLIDGYEETIIGTLNMMGNIPEEDKTEYLRRVHLQHLWRKILYLDNEKERGLLRRFVIEYDQLKDNSSRRIEVLKIVTFNAAFYSLYNVCKYVYRSLRWPKLS